MSFNRRAFLQLLSSSAYTSALPDSIARALSIPANTARGSLADVEHVVFMMQENRSFDHYFGTLQGVRGFGDPRAAKLPTGNSVFYQPDGAGAYVLPFHPPAERLGLQFLEDLPHDWATTHEAWNEGHYDRWVTAKSYVAMAHLQRGDIPYHYALADAFTICDAYHSSLLGPTDPNRYHMFTGGIGNDGQGGGPVVDNSEAGYSWSTFPEVLEAADVSWKIYQDIGVGLDAAGSWGNTSDPYIGNYGNNSLLYFNKYRTAQPGSALYAKARTGTHIAVRGTLFDNLRRDVSELSLPQVSWVVAPEAYSEHPNWPANYGAYFLSEVLNALTSNPQVWSKTVFFITYDENDGFFDHVVPPTPSQSAAQGRSDVPAADEFFPGASPNVPPGPYGLGARVPMLVVSPWSKGGWVNSEVFDHTSLIRFVQQRFGTKHAPLAEPNITAWRHAVCGDLTSAFNFTSPNDAKLALPKTGAYVPPDRQRHASYVPPPPVIQALPVQESGTRPARAVPYTLNVGAIADLASGELTLEFINTGKRTAVFQVRSSSALHPPRTYTVRPGSRLSDAWHYAPLGLETYDLSVYGPNGFFRAYQGHLHATTSANLHSALAYDVAAGGVTLTVSNPAQAACELTILDVYTSQSIRRTLAPQERYRQFFMLSKFHGWYDFVLRVVEDASLRQQLAGHLETGEDSVTDPAIAAR